MMAHQCGVANVVATMGTALNGRHVAQLRRYAPKVVLVFDADDGGLTGVDRALELFVGQDAELAVATLPDGLDPCDLLVQPGGTEVFQKALASAVDAVEFKLNQMLAREAATTIEGGRRIIDAVLGIMALAPAVPSQAGQMKQELIITRLAHRLGIRQETVWARLGELKTDQRRKEREAQARQNLPAARSVASGGGSGTSLAKPAEASGPASATERQLLQLVLADPALVPVAAASVPADSLAHTGLRRVLAELYDLNAAGQPPDLDALRVRLLDRPDLVKVAQDLHFVGRHTPDRPVHLQGVIAEFARKKDAAEKKRLKEQLTADGVDDTQAVELLRRLQGSKPSPN
jgi:DNA primase